MPDAKSFSIGVDRLLAEIRPHGRSTTDYPKDLDPTDTRRGDKETLQSWFVRLVDKYCNGDPALVAMENYIAIFANCGWDKGRLHYVSMPTLIVEGTLEDFYLGSPIKAAYLRLDLNYNTLGQPFSHPLPHIHVVDETYPRFALDGGTAGNVIVDYLEFLYRNYVSDEWINWARCRWRSSASANPDMKKDPFERIIQAYRRCTIRSIRGAYPRNRPP